MAPLSRKCCRYVVVDVHLCLQSRCSVARKQIERVRRGGGKGNRSSLLSCLYSRSRSSRQDRSCPPKIIYTHLNHSLRISPPFPTSHLPSNVRIPQLSSLGSEATGQSLGALGRARTAPRSGGMLHRGLVAETRLATSLSGSSDGDSRELEERQSTPGRGVREPLSSDRRSHS